MVYTNPVTLTNLENIRSLDPLDTRDMQRNFVQFNEIIVDVGRDGDILKVTD